uniref:Reverse transcriptase Ty1/copia-type domain-containing protein n=1 Tax=Strigamia maritima TaxID=126957 RepID=T1IS24_STRMM
MVLFTSNKKHKSIIVKSLATYFNLVDLGLVTKLLGVNFVRTKDGIIMHQIGFIQKLANVFNIVKNEIVKVPVTVGTTLVRCKEGESVEDFPYRSLIGSLMFLASRSRPDILYAVTYLSQFNVLHSGAHVKCLKQVLQYVVNTEHLAINLSHCVNESFFLHVDASWATDLDSCKSFGGHILYLGGAPLSWGCKKQGSVAGSTMESEYIALVHAVKEIYWMSSLFEYYDLLNYVNVPTVFSDSMSSIQFLRNDLENTKTKHMRIKYCMARDWVSQRLLRHREDPDHA